MNAIDESADTLLIRNREIFRRVIINMRLLKISRIDTVVSYSLSDLPRGYKWRENV